MLGQLRLAYLLMLTRAKRAAADSNAAAEAAAQEPAYSNASTEGESSEAGAASQCDAERDYVNSTCGNNLDQGTSRRYVQGGHVCFRVLSLHQNGGIQTHSTREGETARSGTERC